MARRSPACSGQAKLQCEDHGLTTAACMINAPPFAPDFIFSTVAALVCWRAMKKNSGPVEASSPRTLPPASPTVSPMAPPQDKHDEPDLEDLATDSNLPGQAPSSTALSKTAATASTAADDASSAWAPTGYGKSPVPRWLRWPSLLLWNVACIGSLVVALVWFTEDVSDKRVFTGLVGTFNH